MTQPTLPGLTPDWGTPQIRALRNAPHNHRHAQPATCPACRRPTLHGKLWATDDTWITEIHADPAPLNQRARAWLTLYGAAPNSETPLTVLAEIQPGPLIRLYLEPTARPSPPPRGHERLPVHHCQRQYPLTLHLPEPRAARTTNATCPF